jgi:hypothetical protein
VSGRHGNGPGLYGLSYLIGHFTVYFGTRQDSAFYACQGVFGKVLKHALPVKDMGTEKLRPAARFLHRNPLPLKAFTDRFKSYLSHGKLGLKFWFGR